MNDILFAILTIKKNENNAILCKKRIYESLQINAKIFSFVGAKQIDNYCDIAHDLTRNHMEIMKYAIKNGYQYALIFEDDADFYENVQEIFMNVLQEMRKIKIDVLHLGSEPVVGTPIWKVRGNIYQTMYVTCSHAYILSRETMMNLINMKKLIPKNSTSDLGCNMYGSDNQFDYLFLQQFNTKTVYPPICFQNKCPFALERLRKYQTFPFNMSRRPGTCNHSIIIMQKNIFAVYIKYVYLFIILLLLYRLNIYYNCKFQLKNKINKK